MITQESVDTKPELEQSRAKELVSSFRRRVVDGRSGKNLGLKISLKNIDQFLHGIQKARYYLIGADSGVGKCLGKDTKVIMYGGYLKSVQDIVVGDKLMGPDGKPRNVLSTCTGKEQMYWVRQSRGIDYRVNESHILSLSYKPQDTWSTTIKPGQAIISKNKRKREYTRTGSSEESIRNIGVLDYLKEPNKLLYHGWKSPVDFGSIQQDVDPYFVGLWLGDGTRGATDITTNDPEIVSYLKELAEYYELKLGNNSPITYRMSGAKGRKNPLREALRALGIFDDKHVPLRVIRAPREDRLKFIAGLIDSDGYYNPDNNMVEITQKRKELSTGIVLVLRSLGFYATIKDKLATMRRSDGTIYTCLCSRISFSHSTQIPCKVSRKVANRNGLDKTLRTGVTVEKDIVDDYYGFEIDGDKLFLLEDFTVTHNTSIADFIFILEAWRAAKLEGKRLKIIYYSFEIASEEKIANWVSYFVSILYKVDLPTDYIMGYIVGNLITEEDMDKIDAALAVIEEMLSFITMYDTPKNPTAIYHDAIDLATELGEVHYETKISTRIKDKDGKPTKQKHIVGFTPNDPELTVILMLDHIALATPEAGLSAKATIDRLSSYGVFIRNKFRFSLCFIQQFNTEMQTVERRKFSQAAFAPQRGDFGDSKYTYRDADVVLGMIKPAFFDLKTYYGFPIFADGNQLFGLEDNMVSVFLMKNRYGPSNKMMPLFMNGVTKRFFDLPENPDDFIIEEFAEETTRLKVLCQSYSQPNELQSEG